MQGMKVAVLCEYRRGSSLRVITRCHDKNRIPDGEPSMPSHTTAFPSDSRLSIAIIGGGIGGVAFAVALSRFPDLDVQLSEAAPQFSEIGAGLSFGPHADSSAAPFADGWFDWRPGSDDGYLTATLAPGCGQSSVHRADFLDAIVSDLPAGIAHFGKRCVEVTQAEEGATAHFADGSSFTADILIGFDGIKSAVRNNVLPAEEHGEIAPFWSGTYAYRGMIPTAQLEEALEGKGADRRLALVPQMYLGTDRHILTFPVKQSELINVVAFITDRSTAEPQLPAGEEWVQAVTQQEMLEVFADWGAASRAILECIPEPTRWALHELPELPRYHRGRVLLVGDAAHARLPHQGAGAGHALADAIVLGSLLGDEACRRDRVEQVLAAFEAVGHARTCRVQPTSPQADNVYQYAGEALGDDDAKPIENLETRFV